MSARLPAERRRRQLLDVSLRVFAEHGFYNSSMDDIAEAAGVTKPVLYQHFKSKRGLYLEVLDDVGQRLQDAIGKATAGAASPRQQVENGFAAYFQFVADQEDAFRLLFGGGARRGGRADQDFAAATQAVEDAVVVTVAGLIEADIDEEHRLLLAHSIVGLAETASRWWTADNRHRLDPAILSRRIADLAYAGLRGVRR